MKISVVWCLFFLCSCFSFHVNAKDLVDVSSFPEWFKVAIDNEKAVKKKSKLKIKSLDVNAKVLGKIKISESGDNYWYYTLDIGTATPVECYVLTDFDGPANSFHAILDASLENVEKLNGKPMTGRVTYAVDSGVNNGIPYLLLDTLYHVGEGNNKASGTIKGLTARTGDTLQICTHNEIGYRKAFLSVFESFVMAFSNRAYNDAFYQSVYKVNVNGIPVGYGHETYIKDAEGDIQALQHSAFLMPVDASSLLRSDSVATNWSRPDGSVINTESFSVANGAVAHHFALQHDGERWQVKGEMQGKEAQFTLLHNQWLLSNYGMYIESAKLINSGEESAQFLSWLPEADPSSAVTVVMKKIKNNPDANIQFEMGPMKMTFQVDKFGVSSGGVMQVGPVHMVMELIYSEGSIQN